MFGRWTRATRLCERKEENKKRNKHRAQPTVELDTILCFPNGVDKTSVIAREDLLRFTPLYFRNRLHMFWFDFPKCVRVNPFWWTCYRIGWIEHVRGLWPRMFFTAEHLRKNWNKRAIMWLELVCPRFIFAKIYSNSRKTIVRSDGKITAKNKGRTEVATMWTSVNKWEIKVGLLIES